MTLFFSANLLKWYETDRVIVVIKDSSRINCIIHSIFYLQMKNKSIITASNY